MKWLTFGLFPIIMLACRNSPSPQCISVTEQKTNSVPNGQQIKSKYFDSLPPKVKRTVERSVVSVKISFRRLGSDVKIYLDKNEGTGFTVAANIVATAAHGATEYPAVWEDPNTKCEVYDGQNKFKCTLATVFGQTDIMTVEVKNLESGIKFSKSPVVLAETDQNFPEIFYAVSFSSVGPNPYFLTKLGPYWSETNYFDDIIRPQTFGVVGGLVAKGFSGGPLIGPDGKVYGLIIERVPASTPIHTLVSKVADIKKLVRETVNMLEKQKKEKNN